MKAEPPPRLQRLAPANLWLLLQALFWLVVLQAAIAWWPFQRIAGQLGLRAQPPECPLAPDQAAEAARISWAVNALAARAPWQSTCLARALCGAQLLQQRGIAGQLYLGVARQPGRPALSAHAWLCCGETILTGAHGRERYQVVAVFHTKA